MSVTLEFPLTADEEQTIDMPAGSELLHVGTVGDEARLWVFVPSPDGPLLPRVILTYPTGADVRGRYLGTYQLSGVTLHVFDPKEMVSPTMRR